MTAGIRTFYAKINFGISAKRPEKVHSIPANAGMEGSFPAVFCSYSPLTFVGGETSSAEFTPPFNFYRSRKMPGFAAVNCCGLFRPRQMSGASRKFYFRENSSVFAEFRGNDKFYFRENSSVFAEMINFIFGKIPPFSRKYKLHFRVCHSFAGGIFFRVEFVVL